MAKSKFFYSRKLRTLEVPVTDADDDAVVLFDLPRGGIDSIKVYVEDAFNTSAKLAIGIPGTAAYLVSAQAIDATGLFTCTLANYLHSSTADTPITATVSDKSAVGKVWVIINFYVDRDTVL